MFYYYEVALKDVYTSLTFYTYYHPEKISVGSVVQVPFGKKESIGIIVNIVKKPTIKSQIKIISKHYNVSLPRQSVLLLKWMCDYYADPTNHITSLFLPTRLDQSMTNIELLLSDFFLGSNLLPHKPNKEQAKALKIISNLNNRRVLLHGETGSGKTLLFLKQTIDTIKKGLSVLIMTPEIGLTPQLHEIFKKHVHAPIFVNHSDLNNKDRQIIWNTCLSYRGPAVFIGPRSTLFLPFKNLGLIVVDESHDNSYKQLQTPKYHSAHVVGQLAKLHNAQVIHSTATPNVDDYYKMQRKGYKIVRLTQPAGGKHTHKLIVIDQDDSNNFKKSPYFAEQLLQAIEKSLDNNEQVLLLLNRRGTNRLVQCRNCSYLFMCPNCGIPLIYHHDKNILTCHSCNYKQKTPSECPSCSSVDLRFSVIGTKSLVEHTRHLFPNARIARFDADLITKDKISHKFDDIKKGNFDILIGTQLLSKGFDLPNLSVVGVINADSSLNFPDYRAEELTFQQLYQVTGRVTRGYKPTISFIQTRNIASPIIKALQSRSWSQFYNYELSKRRTYHYPPFCFLATIKVKTRSSQKAELSCTKLKKQLQKYPVDVLGPSPSFHEKQNKMHVWQIIIKSPKRHTIIEAIKSLTGNFFYDIDPVTLL